MQTKEVIKCFGEKINSSSIKLGNLSHLVIVTITTAGLSNETLVQYTLKKLTIFGFFEENANNVIAKKSVTSPTVINVTTEELLTGGAGSSFVFCTFK